MIKPFKWLWQQLNGPQIKAIADAILEWFQLTFNAKLNYLNTMSIETADDAHLDIIGSLMGIPRPILTSRNLSQFIFDDLNAVENYDPATPNPASAGFSDALNIDPEAANPDPTEPWNPDVSEYHPYPYTSYNVGHFSGGEDTPIKTEPLSSELYREILLSVSELDECEPQSLAVYDIICSTVCRYCKATDLDKYQIKIWDTLDLQGDSLYHTCGDITIIPGANTDWLNLSQAEAVFNTFTGKDILEINNQKSSIWAPEPVTDYIFSTPEID